MSVVSQPSSSGMAAQRAPGAVPLASCAMTWSLCVSTLNRADALEECVRRALLQTTPPERIVIVDASENWQASRARIATLVAEAKPPVALDYLAARRRSSAAQRNQALEVATGDILFFIDDDSWMAEDCAAQILETYASDPSGRIAAVAAFDATFADVYGGKTGEMAEDLGSVSPGLSQRMNRLRRSAMMRWVLREVLCFSNDGVFVEFDSDRREIVPPRQPSGAHRVRSISGHTMTVRREVALREPFESHLLAYAPCEDLDASYRFSRHGVMYQQTLAKLYHHRVKTSRLKRKQVVALTLLNALFFVRRSSSQQAAHCAVWCVKLLRRLFADLVKDLVRRRLTFPQVRGVLLAGMLAPALMFKSREKLGDWYEGVQTRILGT
jgi:GT2 family glycosyltransferase